MPGSFLYNTGYGDVPFGRTIRKTGRPKRNRSKNKAQKQARRKARR